MLYKQMSQIRWCAKHWPFLCLQYVMLSRRKTQYWSCLLCLHRTNDKIFRFHGNVRLYGIIIIIILYISSYSLSHCYWAKSQEMFILTITNEIYFSMHSICGLIHNIKKWSINCFVKYLSLHLSIVLSPTIIYTT